MNAVLQPHEVKVLRLVAHGCSNQTIAERLGVALASVDGYVYRVRLKAGAADRAALMMLSSAEIERLISRAPRPLLTPREMEVTRLVAYGRSNKEIAKEFGIQIDVVARHVGSILRKLDIDSRYFLGIYAIKAGIVRLEDIKLPSDQER